MMDTEIDRALLEKIADLIGKPVGAFNIRKDSGCDGRQSTEHIEITPKEDKPGIDIRVKPGTVGETCYIPVIITKSGLREMVYNDFFIGEGCDVDIVAGSTTAAKRNPATTASIPSTWARAPKSVTPRSTTEKETARAAG